MLTSQAARSGSRNRHGRRSVRLAELRSRIVHPSQLGDGDRQRLVDLAKRLARVQALGGEYGRVGFSDEAQAALNTQAAG
ncbi:MAG: hypothetical protein ACLFVW_05150 [Phycisphaerae bacterium]